MNLEIYWMRHAVSCNNIKQMLKKITEFYKMKDPSILLESILTIIEMKKYLPNKMKNCKLIFCSEMKRAIQTAIFNFPQHFIDGKIKIIKGINEYSHPLDLGQGNIPQNIHSLKKELKSSIIFLYNFINDNNNNEKDNINNNKDNINNNKDNQINYKKYKKYLLYEYLNKSKNIENTLDKLINKLFSEINNKHFNKLVELREKEYNIVNCLNNYLKSKNISKIAIVSHSNFLSKNIFKNHDYFLHLIRSKKKKLYNNQILYKRYVNNNHNEIKITEKIYPYGFIYKNNTITGFYNHTMLNKYAYNTLKKKKTIKQKFNKISLKINLDRSKNICYNKLKNSTKKSRKNSTKKSKKN